MMKKTLLILSTALLSPVLLSGGPRCGFADAADAFLSRGIRLERPTLETAYQSPSGYFYIHYDTSGINVPMEGDLNLNGIPDYVEEVAVMADSARHVLTEFMGFNPPPGDADGIYDVFITQQSPGTYGVTYLEGGGLSYIQIDNDFEEDQYTTHGLPAMAVTMVHEFFHAVQLGYKDSIGSDKYLYEMSSTWIEDVIVPEVNDYLEFRDELFNDPEIPLHHTNGYSIALYAHYLARMVNGVVNEQESIIIRQIWEEFAGSGHSALNAIKDVLTEEYSTSLCETWTDFLARNIFCGLAPEYYYHPDQAEILGLEVDGYTPVFGIRSDTLVPMDNAAAVKGYRLSVGPENAQQALLALDFGTNQAVTRIAVTGSMTAMYENSDIMGSQVLTAFDKFYLLACSESLGTVSADMEPFYGASDPGELKATVLKHEVFLKWGASPGPDTELFYNVYRDNILTASITDTTYSDTLTEPDQVYTYAVTAENPVSESSPSNIVTITTWPDDTSIQRTAVYRVYPNPVYGNYLPRMTMVLDAGKEFAHPKLSLVNLLGQRLNSKPLPALSQGRHVIPIGGLANQYIPSGIYFLMVEFDSSTIRTAKLLIIN